jgi:hypothetical protein
MNLIKNYIVAILLFPLAIWALVPFISITTGLILLKGSLTQVLTLLAKDATMSWSIIIPMFTTSVIGAIFLYKKGERKNKEFERERDIDDFKEAMKRYIQNIDEKVDK